VYTLGIVKAVTFSMAPERSTKKLCNTEPSAVGIQTFKHRAMVMGMIVTMSLCALWGMPPGMAVACGWAPYFCAWSFEPAMNQWYSALSLTPSPLDLAGTQGAQIVNGKYPMKKLFKLLLNVALAAVSYTDLGGKAQHRTSPDPMHHASTLRGILPLHPVISACGPLHTHTGLDRDAYVRHHRGSPRCACAICACVCPELRGFREGHRQSHRLGEGPR
jgi:hypothetical protein